MAEPRQLAAFGRLIDIMDRLRGPGGCPWDAEQTPQSLIPYLLEEAHETIEAIEQGNPAEVRDELGDLLLQVVFHARIFSEQQEFDVADVADAISDKLIRRHPHVFAGEAATDLTARWEEIKAAEKGEASAPRLTETIPRSLPALQRSAKLVEKSRRRGRSWPDRDSELAAAANHLDAFARQPDDERLGALLFSIVLLARHAGLDPEGALRRCSDAIFAHR